MDTALYKNLPLPFYLLKVATYNVRTLLRDEHIHELEELSDIIRIGDGEKKRGMFHYLTKRPHTKAYNGQAGVGFLINRKWKDDNFIVRVNNISPRVAELVLCITKCYKLKIVQIYAPTTSHSEEDINSFYNDVNETREPKPLHDSDGRLQCRIMETDKPYGNGNGQI